MTHKVLFTIKRAVYRIVLILTTIIRLYWNETTCLLRTEHTMLQSDCELYKIELWVHAHYQYL